MTEGEGEQGYLPPEPGGPEPDLDGRRLDQQPPQPQPAPGYPQPGWQHPPPAYGQPPPGYGPPPPGYGQPPQGWQQQPQGWQQQPPPPGWQGQAQWQQPPAAPQPWAWQPQQPPVPDNGSAVAGFSLSATAGGLLIMSAGLSSIISIICGALGIFYSRRGRDRVDRGETPKHRGLAQAGFVIGILSVVLGVLATIGWIALFSDDNFWDDLEKELDESGGTETSLGFTALRAGALGLRAATSLL